MPREYNQSVLKLTGFDEFLEKLQEAEKSSDVEGRKCFEKASDNLYDCLYDKAKAAGIDEKLLEQIDDRMIEDYGIWYYQVGWKKKKWNGKGEPPDVYKVMFANYGTPKRYTVKKYYRGEIKHRGFIKKAKLAARNKNKKLYKETLQKIIGDLK